MSAHKPVDVDRDGLVLANRETLADLVVREACETEPADPDDPETIKIMVSDLRWVALSAMLVAEPEDKQAERRARDAAVEELIAAAGNYYNDYCQDEADDEFDPVRRTPGFFTGASAEQIEKARELRAALAAVRGGAR